MSPDGSRYAFGRPDGMVAVHDRETGRELWTDRLKPDADSEWSAGVQAVRFSPDGSRLVVAWRWHNGWHTLHDAATGRRIREPIESDRQVRTALTPDGSRLAVPTKDEILILATESGQTVGRISQTKTVSALAFAPDGRRLAMGLYEKSWNNATIEVADLETGALAFEARGHGAFVSSLAWFPDGRRLVSGGFDNTVNVWAADGQALLTLPFAPTGDDRVEHVMVSPDGTKVFATNGFPNGGSGGRNIVTVWRSK
jgi:WD40 repeat protein